jgi:hypothetical protein
MEFNLEFRSTNPTPQQAVRMQQKVQRCRIFLQVCQVENIVVKIELLCMNVQS